MAALNMAFAQLRPEAVIHHSDRGCHYTSYAFGKRCEAGVMLSMGSGDDTYGNAKAESFFANLASEVLNPHMFHSQAEAKMALFEWIERWYNRHRRHSSLGD